MSELETISQDVKELQVDRAADVFRELSDPIRIATIAALVKAERIGEDPLTFAELRRVVDIRDSGRFNYHLQKLHPRFVRSTEEGYRVRYAGLVAYSLVQARTAPEDETRLEGYVDRSCPICGEALFAEYAGDRFELACTSDECYSGQLYGGPISPAVAADSTIEELLTLSESYFSNTIGMAQDGYCAECWGSMSIDFKIPTPPPDLPDSVDAETITETIQTVFECERCAQTVTIPLRIVLADHPAVGWFHYELGNDLSELGLTEIFSKMSVDRLDLSDDRAWIRFEQDGNFLEVSVDQTLAVYQVEMTSS